MTDAMFQVSLIDDDVQVLKALSRVLSIAGYQVQTFTDAETFLDEHDPLLPGCAVVDLHLPGKSGFEIQEALDACGRPVVFLTGQGNVPASVRAMRAGAQDFLEKPVNTQTLLAAVEQARLVDVARRRNFQDQEDLKKRVARLTARERQVLDQVVAGRFNKQIAGDLGIVEKTVKVHRGRMMHKMGVRTVADLVRIVEHFNA
ncbi:MULTISPECIES: response regulator [unclassified Mesorhizobium]|uniref:response regulator transcription factor n=1 Tax=unclassified Mesorhizobium TaxID=325217 RepID=UPI000FCAB7B6|nr:MULTISPECIES: response regulator [unclassified Mesorhizobium]RVD61998.1 response regulator transcription factor [Mesorhizobium sp. M8A.F.Ca.ET.023.02.2.1]RWC69861.1 MAG: response regulator transcription factor [Mesorhizobium sp.]TGU89970.1 response regulator transcription factor [Mesorhizobium sp. M00.F.Ca.ET.151.01.1.1]RUW54656.1 response regulator transcription factor [Mesorhizobium sp. M8A.F.Ca.ET.021.01.1.1]TGT42710.1 response regulator transcription factor [Mesorhizobium sp. M8A.F.Ca.E